MKLSKKGAALMQVLLITLILAGIATMLLRVNLSRMTSARKTRRTVSAQMLIQSCMAEVNQLWTSKNINAFYRDFEEYTTSSQRPYMYCLNEQEGASDSVCAEADRVYTYECFIADPYDVSHPYVVTAQFEQNEAGVWQLAYEITSGSNKL